MMLVLVLLVTFVAGVGTALLRGMSKRDTGLREQQRSLARAADALRGDAFRRRCLTPALANDALLRCPDLAGPEGDAATSCPGLTRGWLPWRTLGLPPQRDASATCLWYERNGTTARVIAAGAPGAAQNRMALANRPVCGGHYTASDYLDAADASVTLVLDTANFAARCP